MDRMRSLSTKLTLAFVLVGVIGAVLVALIVQQRTRSAFGEFLLDRDQEFLVTVLLQYYQLRGSWDGVSSIFTVHR